MATVDPMMDTTDTTRTTGTRNHVQQGRAEADATQQAQAEADNLEAHREDADSVDANSVDADRADTDRERAQLRRHISSLLDVLGAPALCCDWSDVVERLVQEHLHPPSPAERAAGSCVRLSSDKALRRRVKHAYWSAVLDLIDAGDPSAFTTLWRTLLRLISAWDRRRELEADWEDIAQQIAIGVVEFHRDRRIRRAWGLIYRAAYCRFIDAIRRHRGPIVLELPIEPVVSAVADRVFVQQALARLPSSERRCIELIDLEGLSRSEASVRLRQTPGRVLTLRRRGLRDIWRWLGEELSDVDRRLWFELFKGGERATPERVSARVGMSPEEARNSFERSRAWLGL